MGRVRTTEEALLLSCLAGSDGVHPLSAVLAWFEGRRQANRCTARPIPFAELDQWHFTPDGARLVHRTGKFFSVEGIHVELAAAGTTRTWDQPIIRQPEIGILGIIARSIDGVLHLLMQAKAEPGNVHGVQLAPTVQATWSNYSRVHNGKRQLYLDYFTNPGASGSRVLVDQLQREHTSRFLDKRNRNMIVEVDDSVSVHDDFCWLTLGQIHQLLTYNNLVNMDARSVLSCIRPACPSWKFATPPWLQNRGDEVEVHDLVLSGFARDLWLSLLDQGSACHSIDELLAWSAAESAAQTVSVQPIAVSALNRWRRTTCEIQPETGSGFSVMAVAVDADNREVSHWTQPLLKHPECGLVGLLVQKHQGLLHFLIHAQFQPGNSGGLELGPTVVRETAPPARGLKPVTLLDHLVEAKPEWVRLDSVQSEEGGRFFRFQNRYRVVEIPPERRLDIPQSCAWLTLGQMLEFARYGWLNIEARNLVACLGLCEENYRIRGQWDAAVPQGPALSAIDPAAGSANGVPVELAAPAQSAPAKTTG